MVRLLQSLLSNSPVPPKRFQSHNGAIAAICQVSELLDNLKVSIPQWCDCCNKSLNPACHQIRVSIPQWCDCCTTTTHYRSVIASFNPTMVRLLPIHQSRCRRDDRLFQSHNGAIAAEFYDERRKVTVKVSIPQWCDCCGSQVA